MFQESPHRPPTVHDLGPQGGRPHVTLANAGVENINARFVLARLAAWLAALEVGDPLVPGAIRRRILVIPAQAPETLGADLCALARSAWHHVEIVTGETGMDALPQVHLPHPPSDDERATACLFGLPSVIEPATASAALSPPWTRSWQGVPGERFVIQLGHGDDLQPMLCERLFRALVAFLMRVDAVSGITLADEEEDLHYFDASQVFRLTNRAPGLFVFRQAPGHWLQAGDLLGYVYDERDGSLLEEVRSPVAGLLASLRRRPLVDEGAVLAVIHRRTG
jgi:predicted deacylase